MGMVMPLDRRYVYAEHVSTLSSSNPIPLYNIDNIHLALSHIDNEVRFKLSVVVSICEPVI